MFLRIPALLCATALFGTGILHAQDAGDAPAAPAPAPEANGEDPAPPEEKPAPAKEETPAAPAEQPKEKAEIDDPAPPPAEAQKKANLRVEARAKAKAAAEADLAMVDGTPTTEMIPLLGHERFRVREHAQKRLIDLLGEQFDVVGDLCYEAYTSTPDPEIRLRARAVLLELVQRSIGTSKRGFVGVGLLLHAFFDKKGEVNFAIRISEVRPNTPAQKAGLRVDDLITGIDNVALADKDATQRFMDIVGAMPPGREVTLKYRRDGKDLEVNLILMARPELPGEDTPKADPEKLLRKWLDERKKAGTGQ